MIGIERKSAVSRSDLLLDLLGTAGAKSGVAVTWETALQAASAIACARVIAEGIAQVPLKLYRRRPDGGADAAKLTGWKIDIKSTKGEIVGDSESVDIGEEVVQ
jgi:hypothetical protein